MDDAVAVPLKHGPDWILGLWSRAAATGGASSGLWRKELIFEGFELVSDAGHDRKGR
jgi:hypothetical protein